MLKLILHVSCTYTNFPFSVLDNFFSLTGRPRFSWPLIVSAYISVILCLVTFSALLARQYTVTTTVDRKGRNEIYLWPQHPEVSVNNFRFFPPESLHNFKYKNKTILYIQLYILVFVFDSVALSTFCVNYSSTAFFVAVQCSVVLVLWRTYYLTSKFSSGFSWCCGEFSYAPSIIFLGSLAFLSILPRFHPLALASLSGQINFLRFLKHTMLSLPLWSCTYSSGLERSLITCDPVPSSQFSLFRHHFLRGTSPVTLPSPLSPEPHIPPIVATITCPSFC